MNLFSKQLFIAVSAFAALLLTCTTVQSSQEPINTRLLGDLLSQKTSSFACGDFGNGNGGFQAGIAYLFAGGPAPIDASIADVDDHEGFNFGDICVMSQQSNPNFVCPPTQQSLHLLPPDSSTIFTISPSQIAAGQSVTTVTISFSTPHLIPYAAEIPLKIEVCGKPPTLDNVNMILLFPFGVIPQARGFTYDDSTGILILYYVGYFDTNKKQDGERAAFAQFDILSVPSTTCVPITFTVVETGPMTGGVPGNIPLFVSSTMPTQITLTPYRPVFSIALPDTLCGCSPVCCVPPVSGNVNMAGGITVADLIYLVQYLFNSGPVPPCAGEANVNGNGSVTIADLTYLVQYLFNSGALPSACP